jgi:predicted metalloprotease with PDZ domain
MRAAFRALAESRRIGEDQMKRRLALLISILYFVALAHAGGARALAQGASGGGGSAAQVLKLSVDATDAPRKLFRATEVIPAQPGPLTLYYPEWLPGEHGPTGPIINLSGLRFNAAGKSLQWRRDPVDMYAFHVDVPQGASSVEVSMEFLAPTFSGGFSSGSATTAHLAIYAWNWLLLYPQVAHTDDLPIDASIRLPAGWKYGTGLDTLSQTRGLILFKTASLTKIVDSPVLAGEYFRVLPLSTAKPAVEMDIAADSPSALEASPKFINAARKLVAEARALFGAEHYEHYNFLFTLSDRVAHFGLEHHQSNDSRVAERALLDETQGRLALGVLPHEYFHSWNGKYRRPAGLATSDYQKPMQGELLWVYEGLTEYYGNVLSARSGIWTPEEYRDELANVAANLGHRPGRTWRPLIDTTVAAQLLYNAPGEWEAERRSVDFYDEGELIWLDADTLIRQLTNGRRSLDDFCKRFHGGQTGAPEVRPYTFDDVVSTLNEVAPYDWRTFLNERLWSLDARAPLGGIERGGWRVTYDDTRSQHVEDLEDGRERVEMAYSLGMRLNTAGLVGDVVEGAPASSAGLSPGMTVVAVDGKAYTPAVLRDAVTASKTRKTPIQLLVNNEGALQTFSLDYHGGPVYPHLTRDNSKPDLLTHIITPLTGTSVGIADCDEFIEKYERCVKSKVPESARNIFSENLESMRANWRAAAATPKGRAALTQGCRSALEQARASLSTYGCAW